MSVAASMSHVQPVPTTTTRVRDLPGMKSSILFSDEFTPISKPPIGHHEKVTLGNHSNVYHPSQLHTGHHRKPSPSPDHTTMKEAVAFNEKEPVTVFTTHRRPSASPVNDSVRDMLSGDSVAEKQVLHRKPCPSPSRPTSATITHDTTTSVPAVVHKKQANVDHSSMKSLVNQTPSDSAARRVRASPGGTDHIILG